MDKRRSVGGNGSDRNAAEISSQESATAKYARLELDGPVKDVQQVTRNSFSILRCPSTPSELRGSCNGTALRRVGAIFPHERDQLVPILLDDEADELLTR